MTTVERPTRVLVTGATGFVGRQLVAALAENGVLVRALVHRGREAVVARPGVDVVQGSVTDPRSLHDAMERVDAVAHLVAVIRERPPRSPFNASTWRARATSSARPATRGFRSSFT